MPRNRRDNYSRDEHRNGQRDDYRNLRRSPPRDRDIRDYRNAPSGPSSLPARPPPRGYDDGYRPQSYRDSQNHQSSYRNAPGDQRDQRVPPPRSPPPPLPRGPPPPSFGRDSFRPPQGDFTFRADKPAGIQENSYDTYRPNGGQNRPRPSRPDRRDRRNDRGRPGVRPPYRRFVAAERELLSAQHFTNEERVMFNTESEAKYKAIEDLSDSDEAEMDISGGEGSEDGETREPSTKRARLTDNKPAEEDIAVPKWSNPDPYTALPPPDTVTNQKKKDVVHMIRKARVQASEAKSSIPQEAVDFISCDFDDSDDSEDGMVLSFSRGVPGAPTGPRADLRASNQAQNSSAPPAAHFTVTLTRESQKTPTNPNAAGTRPLRDETSSSGLAGRKRTHDDQIKLPEHARLKKAVKVPVMGSFISEWKIAHGEDPTPWSKNDHSDSPNLGVWLHKEIIDFYDHVKPCDFEETIRGKIADDLQAFCRGIYGRISLLPFGSFPAGLYLPTGDMDLAFVSDQYVNGGAKVFNTKSTLWRFAAALKRHGMAHLNEVEVIAHAKVPIVKYIEKRSGLKMDISFENITGVEAISTFQAWKEQYPAMPILVTLIKHFLCMRGLNEPVNGGIGGFSVICLVVSMLQMMPQVQSQNMKPAHHLGELLMEFFDLYGNRFNFHDVAISLNPPKYIPKNQITAFAYHNTDRLSIVDPNNTENDIAGGSKNYARIASMFSEAHQLLQERMSELTEQEDRHDASILQVILAGNYSSFRYQRDHLRRLHERGLDFEAREKGHRHTQW